MSEIGCIHIQNQEFFDNSGIFGNVSEIPVAGIARNAESPPFRNCRNIAENTEIAEALRELSKISRFWIILIG